MKLHNILAIMRNDARVISRVKFRMLEISYFPITTLLIWGLFALYSRQYAAEAGLIVLVVNMFWSFSQLAQQQANMLMMEDLWTASVRHVFIAGVTEFEYVIAKILTSTTAAVAVTSVMICLAQAFGAPLFANISSVAALVGIALLGSVSMAVIITGCVFLLGREYGFLTWSSLHLFVFLSAPFYSPSIFPAAIRWITEIMPFTYVFQGARAIATGSAVPEGLLTHALLVVLAYFAFAWPFYWLAFRMSRRTGRLARLAS
jgi:ABC-2 type transport system permease protein